MAETEQQREPTIEEVRRAIRACRRCPLREVYDSPVPGVGPAPAPLFIIGEAPGYEEVVQGEPFVGPAGQLLRALMREVGISEADRYICNVIHCRPPGNRFPTDTSIIRTCLRWASLQLKIVRPQIVLALGGHALRFTYGSGRGITAEVADRMQGKAPPFKPWKLKSGRVVDFMATLHPSFCLRPPNVRSSNPIMSMDVEHKQRLLRNDLELIARRIAELRAEHRERSEQAAG